MFRKIIKIFLLVMILGIIFVFFINNMVKTKYGDKIIDVMEASDIEDVDAIVVLGAKVNEKAQISLMLKDRLDKGIEVLNLGVSDVLLMSGDGVSENNNETFAMVNYANIMNVDNKYLKEDKEGLSTSKSMYRLKDVYHYKKVVIVTQEYHLYRALYIANEIGIDAYGVSARDKKYRGQWYRELREILARCKDFILVWKR